MRPTLRTLAAELGLSAATVSLALRGDARIHADTAARVKAAAERAGYHADPVVAEGLSRARRREFFRETLVWALDRPRTKTPWLAPLFSGAEAQAKALGYTVEFALVGAGPDGLRRAARTWRARGVRGVVLGPLAETWNEPALPWDHFAWVSVGGAIGRPRLHRVGRDYALDVERALEALAARGVRRPGFLGDRATRHLFEQPMLRAALTHFYRSGEPGARSYFEVDATTPAAELRRWREAHRPDGVLLARSLRLTRAGLEKAIGELPRIMLSVEEAEAAEEGFVPNYGPMGEAAVNLLHRLLRRPETGVPSEPQRVLVASVWRGKAGVSAAFSGK